MSISRWGKFMALRCFHLFFYLIAHLVDERKIQLHSRSSPWRIVRREESEPAIEKLQIHNHVYTAKPPFDRSSEKLGSGTRRPREEENIFHFNCENSSFSDDMRFNENCFSIPFCVLSRLGTIFPNPRHWFCNRQTHNIAQKQHTRLIPLSTRTSISILDEAFFHCIIFPRSIFGILTILLMYSSFLLQLTPKSHGGDA